jgi:hypothetical protein
LKAVFIDAWHLKPDNYPGFLATLLYFESVVGRAGL